MTATLFKEVGYSVSKLIAEIESGEIGLPDMQRPFVWSRTRVRDLFDSMYRGFPVGHLLFWANANVAGAKQIGTDGKQSAPRLLIVDGQQRLTSLYAVIHGQPVVDENYREGRIQIAFRPKDQTFSVADATTRRDPEFIDDVTELWQGELSRNRFVKRFLERLRNAREVSDNEEDDLSEAIDRLFDLPSYPFTALELSPSVDEEQVADVFVRINSKGVSLNQADFILTLMSVFWDSGRRDLEAFSRAAKSPSTSGPSPFNHFIEPGPDQMLRVAVGLAFRRGRLKSVYSILRGRDIETDSYSEDARARQFQTMQDAQSYALDLTNWHEFLKVLVRAGYRSGSMISSQNGLLYSYILFLIGKRDFKVEPHTLRELIARWHFMSSLTGRYTNSPESAIEADLGRLQEISTAEQFVALLDRQIAGALTNDYWDITLPGELGTSSARSPSLLTYYASLNLLDARVLFSKMRVSELFDPALKSKKSALERHHLFPRSYLKSTGVTRTREINQIANYALVEWPDNIAISDTAPSEYFPSFTERLTEQERTKMMFWHALPKGWENLPYEQFLEERRELIAKVIRQGFERLRSGQSEVESHSQSPQERTAADIISEGESARVEFKSSARWNLHKGGRDEKMEQVIVKTIAGFMNADGGTLLIGVNDDGEAVGLANDYSLLRKQDRDGFELWLMDLCENHIGKTATTGLTTSFAEISGQDVCRVDVSPSPRPIFVRSPKGPKSADFYLRIGNSTRQLSTDDVLEYEKDRWTN